MHILPLSDFSQAMFQAMDLFVDSQPDGLFYHKKEWLEDIFPSIVEGEQASFVVVENKEILALFPLFVSNRTKIFHRIAYHSPAYDAFPLYQKNLSEKKLLQLVALIQEHLKTLGRIIIRGYQSPLQALNWPQASLWDFLAHTSTSFRAHQVVFLEKYSLKKDAVSSFYRYISRATKVVEPVVIAQDSLSKSSLLERVLKCYKIASSQKDGIANNEEAKRKLYELLLQNEASRLYCLIQGEEVVSYAIVLVDSAKRYAYYSDGFTRREKEYWGTNSLLHSSIIEDLQIQDYLLYDLSAAMMQEVMFGDQKSPKNRIYSFKRDMGARLVFTKKTTYCTSRFLVNRILPCLV